MPESDDPLTKLARFTPALGVPERDALMFAAGRASVRRSRKPMLLVGFLACTQLLTLVFWWPAPTPPESKQDVIKKTLPAEEIAPEPPTPIVPRSFDWVQEIDRPLPPTGISTPQLMTSASPLRAGNHSFE